MKKYFLFVITILLSFTLFAQGVYDRYLQSAYTKLREGNVVNAEQLYTAYKSCTGKTDANFEALLKQLKQGKNTTHSNTKTVTVKGVSFDMVWVEGGTFQMGSGNGDSDEKPVHSVTLDGYYIGKYEVTQALWQAVMGSNPSYFKGNNNPVENVSWGDCMQFIYKLIELTGLRFSLPTEAQWEYAARGGGKSRGYTYSGGNMIEYVAWFSDNSGSKTHPVGLLQPNELGVCDMTGNVWEWCSDWYDSGYYSKSPSRNPVNTSAASYRVLRGGGWSDGAEFCRVAFRRGDTPTSRLSNLGLRLVLLP